MPNIQRVGDLRHLVMLATREDVNNLQTTGITERYTDLFQTWADIRPVGTQTFINGFELGVAVTHRIIIRWYDRLDEFAYVIRLTKRMDNTTKQELFKIQRTADMDGKQVYSILDVQIEQNNANNLF